MNEIDQDIFYGLILAVTGFLLSQVLTPLYTYFAYKYKFWKKQKKTTVDGKALPIMTKLHAHKFNRHFPTMAKPGYLSLVSSAAPWSASSMISSMSSALAKAPPVSVVPSNLP